MSSTAGMETPISALPPAVRPGVALLAQARWYADDLRRDRWDFAVEIRALRRAGLSLSDLRWLVCREYVEHAREVTVMGAAHRDFHCHGGLTFSRRTAFVLTDSGMNAIEVSSRAEAVLRRDLDGMVAGVVSAVRPQSPAEFPVKPTWDRDRHELRFEGDLVKVFKLPSPNQEMVLAAFEEEGWPARIDDPLPPSTDLEPKRRLHDTIKSLNRNQKARRIRFMGDGTGQGIQWAMIAAEPDASPGNATTSAE